MGRLQFVPGQPVICGTLIFFTLLEESRSKPTELANPVQGRPSRSENGLENGGFPRFFLLLHFSKN
jgi:hypothetical protein